MAIGLVRDSTAYLKKKQSLIIIWLLDNAMVRQVKIEKRQDRSKDRKTERQKSCGSLTVMTIMAEESFLKKKRQKDRQSGSKTDKKTDKQESCGCLTMVT